MKSKIYWIVNIAFKYVFCVLAIVHLTSSSVYAAKAFSLQHIISTAHDFTCTYFQYDQAYKYIVNHGFSYIKDGRYYGRFLGEEYENDDKVDIKKYEGV